MSDDATISDLYRKIEREKALITAANNMRAATNNSSVNSRLESSVRDARRNIKYFEETLQDLQSRKIGGDMQNMSLGAGNGGPPPPAHGGRMTSSALPQPSQNPYEDSSSYGNPGPGGYSEGGGRGLMPPRAPYAPPGPSSTTPKARPNWSRLGTLTRTRYPTFRTNDCLDLIKADTQHLGPRIQLMLSQLEFKLSVEKQYKDGIEKMVRLYQIEGDRKSKAEAEGRRIESSQKMQLLRQALKRHEDLHVDIGADMQDGKLVGQDVSGVYVDKFADDSLNMPSQRKPLSGHLSLRIHAVSDVDHAATSRFSRGPETFVVMKVEDNFKGRTKATRTDKWLDEQHEFDIEKANEIELTVYDRAGEHPQPIGMLWIRISDIAEDMRRKRIETEFNNSGWISADKMGEGAAARPDLQFSPPPTGQGATGNNGGAADQNGPVPFTAPILIDDWFSLEPAGRIRLSLSFGTTFFTPRKQDVANVSVQSSKPENADNSTSDLDERVLFVRKKKKSSSKLATSLFNRRFTTSCAALCAATFSSIRLVCSVPIVG